MTGYVKRDNVITGMSLGYVTRRWVLRGCVMRVCHERVS